MSPISNFRFQILNLKSPTLLSLLLVLAGCTVGPDYTPPETHTPTAYRYEGGAITPLPLGPDWWVTYGDPQLDTLILRATEDNPSLAAALARVDRAAATVGVARSQLFPQADFFAEAARLRSSGNTGGNNRSPETRNDLRTALGLSWEVDAWGRVRRITASALAEAQAQADAFAYSIVLLQTSVAETYLRIRIIDRSIGILTRTVEGRHELLEIAEIRQESGLGDELEVAQARTEWAAAAADLQANRRARALAENALAVLTGSFPENFSLEPKPQWEPDPPPSPMVIPSELLQRRPDIAEAERLVAAASERIGARVAEYYPRIQITGNVGFAASDASNWFTRNSLFGALGPSVDIPLFTGGLIKSQVAQAEAEYRELLATYRHQVIDAFRQVEDALAQLTYLRDEIEAQQTATTAANRAAALARQRYESGLVNYLEVVDTERIALSTSLRLNQIQGERIGQQIALVRALGGGWQQPVAVVQ